MKISMNIPDREWYALAGRAERSGVKVADMVAAVVVNLIRDSDPKRLVLTDQVQHLVESGIPDMVISHRLRVSVEHVRTIRRRLGLRAVKFRRDQWEHELLGPGLPGLSHSKEAS